MKIKQLEWVQGESYTEAVYDEEGNEIGTAVCEGWHGATAPVTGKVYSIYKEPGGLLYYPVWDCWPGFELLEDAKACAQAEFETCILEALE